METILMIGSICSAVLALTTLATLVFKRPKQWIHNWIKNITKEQLDEQLTVINDKLNQLIEQSKKREEDERIKLGHSIMTIYDRSAERGYITLADRKDVIELHQSYHDKHGNHHVDEYFQLMMNMETREK